MLKPIWGGLILILVVGCAPVPVPVPLIETKTPEPKFWREFPVMPGGVEIDDNIGAYHYTVIASIDSVVKFYRKQMKDTEWELIGVGETIITDEMESAQMWFANNESIVSLQVWSKAVLTHVVFIIVSRYPTPKPKTNLKY